MNLRNLLITFAVLPLFSTHMLFSQWASVYSNTGTDYPHSIVWSNGYLYVAGVTWTGVDHENNGLLIKYNNAGDSSWIRYYDGPTSGEDEFFCTAVDKQGSIITAGQSESGTNYDFVTLKYSASGNVIWTNRYNGAASGPDAALCLGTDDSSNVYVSGYTKQTASNSVITSIKYNAAGVQQWVRNFFGDSVGMNTPNAMKISAQTGNTYITGFVSTTDRGSDLVILKYDRSGVLIWSKRINGSGNADDAGTSIAIDANENVYVTGFVSIADPNPRRQMILLKFNSNGDQLWSSVFNRTSSSLDAGRSVTLNTAGNIFVAGDSYVNSSQMNSAYMTLCYTASGIRNWVTYYDNNGTCCLHLPNSVLTDQSGYVYTSGKSDAGISGLTNEIAVIKYDAQTSQQKGVFRYHFNNGIRNEPTSSTLDSAGNYYVSSLVNTGSLYEIGTLMIPLGIFGIKRVSDEVPQHFSLRQNYPNPFNPVTEIEFDLPTVKLDKVQQTKLVVTDILGREVRCLVNQPLTAGKYRVSFDASGYSSGIYYYTLITDNFSKTRKMVILK